MTELPEEPSRPLPQPEHDITPRKPRTVGGAVYLLVLAAMGLGLLTAALGSWRPGLTLCGGALVVGAVARLLLPQRAAGMLGVRRKLVDVVTLLAMGGALVTLAAVIPDSPPV